MGEWADRLVHGMEELPEALVYLIVALFAGLENLVPPVPADVIALAGGFLAGRGVVNPWIVFLVVWAANVATSLVTWWIGRRYGPSFFSGRLGRLILQPGQLSRLAAFYATHGAKVIFVSRFLPGFRAVTPVFAGTSRLSLARTAAPIALASAIWYGAVVYAGATAGRNWEEIRAAVERSGRWFAVAAGVLFLLVAWWWWRTRAPGSDGSAAP